MDIMYVLTRNLCPTLKGCEWGYLVLTEKDWSQEYYWHINGCHFVSFVMYISGANRSLKNIALIFPEIFLIHDFAVQFPHLHTDKNINITKTKKVIPKRKTFLFTTILQNVK